MTDKTLDEKVAEALGWLLKPYEDEYTGRLDLVYINLELAKEGDEDSNILDYLMLGFFTESIHNCKKYIEPELCKQAIFRFTKQAVPVNIWSVEGWDNPLNIIFYATGETEEIAYCNALLALKEREKCQ